MSALPLRQPQREPVFRYEPRRGTVAIFTAHGAIELDLGDLIVQARLTRPQVQAMVTRSANIQGLGLKHLGWAKGLNGGKRVSGEDDDPEP